MDWMLFFVFFAACVAAGSTGGLFSPGQGYDNIAKPPWTPPDWLFPLAWTVLYISIAVAGCLVTFWRLDPVSGALFIPYLMWGTYAGALNFWIWRNNNEPEAVVVARG